MDGMEPMTNSPTPILVQETVLQLIADDEPGQLIPATFRYDQADPYAVSLVAAGPEGSVEWTFARDLLDQGMVEPTGVGDVHVWTGMTDDCHPALFIELLADDAEATVAVLPADVRIFLARSHEQVPPGSESAYCDIDAVISSIFSAVSNGRSED